MPSARARNLMPAPPPFSGRNSSPAELMSGMAGIVREGPTRLGAQEIQLFL